MSYVYEWFSFIINVSIEEKIRSIAQKVLIFGCRFWCNWEMRGLLMDSTDRRFDTKIKLGSFPINDISTEVRKYFRTWKINFFLSYSTIYIYIYTTLIEDVIFNCSLCRLYPGTY